MATEKDYKALTDEELGTQLMALKHAKDGIESSIRACIDEAVARGYAGKDIPTKGGENIVHLTRGLEDKLSMELAREVMGDAKVDGYLEDKRARVDTLTKTDLKGLVAPAIMEKICIQVEATVKAEVKKKK